MKNKEIAQLLQISPATVSLALNNKPGVDVETRRRVLELKESSLQTDINEINKAQEKGTIGLLIYKNRGDIIAETPFFTAIIEAINSDTRLSAYKLNIVYNHGNNIHKFIKEINDYGLKGLIVVATEMTLETAQLLQQEMKIPFVLVDACFPECNVDCVLMNNRGGILKAVKYAYRAGHRKIGFLKSRQTCNNFTERFESYKSALEQLELEYNYHYVFPISAEHEKGCAEMEAFLNNIEDMPTMLIAANDRIAMAAGVALRKAGYRLPEDISMIGFDDMPAAQLVTPRLTSIRLNVDMIARLTVRRLVEKIENPQEIYTVQQYVDVSLVKRDSVKEII